MTVMYHKISRVHSAYLEMLTSKYIFGHIQSKVTEMKVVVGILHKYHLIQEYI